MLARFCIPTIPLASVIWEFTMDVAEPNLGTAFTVPPGVVTVELVGLAEPNVAGAPDAITTLGEELDPGTAVGVTVWPDVAVGTLTKADAGSP